MVSQVTGEQLINLKDRLITKFDSYNWTELAALTNKLEEVQSHPRLLRSLSWGDPDYEEHAIVFLRKMIGPNDENISTVTSYLDKICGVNGVNVSSAKSINRPLVFSPSVFSVPNFQPNERLIAVMMPFTGNFSPVYYAINEVSQRLSFSCLKADDIWNHSTVIQDVFDLIFRSFIVICDFTGKNPNVFYEAGIAHTLGKHVIPITQHAGDIPFDLQHHRYLHYLNNAEGLVQLQEALKLRVEAICNEN